MKNFKLYNFICILLVFGIISCDNSDYILGEGLHDPKINMSTYDYLKSNQFGYFDTLIMLIDKAGIKDKINENGITFFAPTDYSINNYILSRTLDIQNIDPNKMWTVDSIIKYELDRFADSIGIYIVKDLVPNSVLNESGTIYNTSLNNKVVASYEETTEDNMGENDYSSVIPKVVYFTYLYQELQPGFDIKTIQYPVGVRTLVQTSNAQTTTGVLHVLANSHILFYYR